MADQHQVFEARLHQHARRVIPPGSFVVPLDAAFALGDGNGEAGEGIIAKMFKAGRYSETMPRILPPEIVREIGHGDIAKGKRVLEKFVADLRAKQQPGTAKETAEPQGDPDGGKAGYFYERVPLRYAEGGRVGTMSKADAGYEDCGDSGRICAICSMWRDDHKCSLVTGFISRTGTCNYFKPRKAVT